MANHPAQSWGGVEEQLMGSLGHWTVSEYDTIIAAVVLLIGAFWGIKAGVV